MALVAIGRRFPFPYRADVIDTGLKFNAPFLPSPFRWLRRHVPTARRLQVLLVFVALLVVVPYPILYVVAWVRPSPPPPQC